MKKLTGNNSFTGGLVTDLSVFNTPNNTVIDALNLELITTHDDQYLLQNIRGNETLEDPATGEIVDLGKYTHNGVDYKYIPLGLKTYADIAYILIGAFEDNGDFITGAVGTFPSPDWDAINNGQKSLLIPRFSILHNFKTITNTSGEYTDPFISDVFKFKKNAFIDIVIQGDFDRSANIIYTDNIGATRIINSRFRSSDQYGVYELAERRGDKDSNTYTDEDWDRINLIQSSDFPIAVSNPLVTEDGTLFGGGYKYFFKYITQEGNTTDILYESSLIPIANGGLGLDGDQRSNKQVEFSLYNLDTSYQGIQVYFAHFNGSPKASAKYFKINYVYSYSGNKVTIKHSGLEEVKEVQLSEINTTFTPIDTVKTIDIINDRLALANVTASLHDDDISIMEAAAKTVTIWERYAVIGQSYSDPNTASSYLGYWKGEVYEFGIVFMIKGKGLSPVFPMIGMDNIDNIQNTFGGHFGSFGTYPAYTIGVDGFDRNNHLINEKGIFRTSKDGIMYNPSTSHEEGNRYPTYIHLDTSQLKDNAPLVNITTGYFIVRRERVKNTLMQGMLVPTLRLPAYRLSSCPVSEGDNRDFIGNFRNTSQYFNHSPVIGLNTKYFSVEDSNDKPIYSVDFPTVQVPQPTQIINVLTHEKAWAVQGGIGQNMTGGRDIFGKYVDQEGDEKEKQYVAFYSCEIDLNSTAAIDRLTGSSPALEIQKARNNESPVGICEVGVALDPADLVAASKLPANTIVKTIEQVSGGKADFVSVDSTKIVTTFITSGTQITASESFSGKLDRVYGYNAEKETSDNIYPPHKFKSRTGKANDGTPINYSIRTCKTCTNIVEFNPKGGDDFYPYSLISQSYSLYLGIKIETEGLAEVPEFIYSPELFKVSEKSLLANSDIVVDPRSAGNYFVNVGHLTNIFSSGKGRWDQDAIVDIYKYDSNKPYYAVTDRHPLSHGNLLGGPSAYVFRGDAFISRFFKRITYKNGVGLKGANAGDAGTFKVGLNEVMAQDKDKIPDRFKDDKGRNLFDVGQIIEIVTQSNINADIRSVEHVSDSESSLIGYDRDFYPHRESLFSDDRPDSTKYNDGYSPTNQVIPYYRISEKAATLNTEFPNRILLSEKNQVQEFYNSFRDLRGFNFRDYGVEYGPIQKIVAINGAILSIHNKGLLLIGVDDRTLIAEGSDIYIDTAKALSPKAAVISDLYGTSHPESIIKTDTSVIGVDYNADTVWMFVGNKITVISEFTIKTLLKKFKNKIITADFADSDPSIIYAPRVYCTFSNIKHTLVVTYVAENLATNQQYHVGTVTYNTVLNKWMSTISEGNKFLMRITGNEYSFGFSEIHNIWKEDSLRDPVTGKYIRSRLRGKNYNTEFEIIINENPTYEKILENIIVLCNKRIPTKLIFKTSGDVNDPAIDIWGANAMSMETVQPIMTREDSSRKHLGVGILDQNAQYRDSKLYIEVGKVKYSIKDANNKRVRDKHIKVRFIYEGNDELFVQAIISILSISQN